MHINLILNAIQHEFNLYSHCLFSMFLSGLMADLNDDAPQLSAIGKFLAAEKNEVALKFLRGLDWNPKHADEVEAQHKCWIALSE